MRNEARHAEIVADHLAGKALRRIAVDRRTSRSQVREVLKKAALRGECGYRPVLPGFEVARTSVKLDAAGEVAATYVTQRPERGEAKPMPAGHVVKGVSVLEDADGRVIQRWVKTKEGERDVGSVVAAIRAGFEGFESFAPVLPASAHDYRDMLALFPLADLHMGMQAWGRETMGPNWDLKIAKREISALAAEIMSATPPCREAIILGGGDAMHADNNSNQTSKSHNTLDVDGRYDKVLHATAHLFVEIVEMALARHERVLVRILKGNHDEHASVGLGLALQMRYHDHPRVTVDTTPSSFWFHRFGKVMLGALHGHEAKPKDLPGLMAALRPEDWGRSAHRYGHAFHVHHASKILDEVMGVKVETHRTPTPKDAWHSNSGYISGRELRSIIYHPERGEFGGSVRTAP